jgi:hypothetical protein
MSQLPKYQTACEQEWKPAPRCVVQSSAVHISTPKIDTSFIVGARPSPLWSLVARMELCSHLVELH